MICALAALAGCTSSAGTPPPRSTLSPADESTLIQESIDTAREELLARFPLAEVPDVPIVRIVDEHEWASTIAHCLTQAGFPATSTSDSVSLSVAAGQEEAQAIAYFVCAAQYPSRPEAPLVEEEIRYLYAYYTGELSACLSSQGYSVDGAPSLEKFVENYLVGDYWSPYTSLPPLNEEQWLTLNDACPQSPF